MIRLKFIAALACIGLMACQPFDGTVTNGNVTSAPPATSGPAGRTVADERLLYAAEAAYNVPAHAYVTADSRGQLPPALKARIRPLLIDAYARLQDARRLYNLGNAQNFRDAANAAIGLANSARDLMPASSLAPSTSAVPGNPAEAPVAP